MAVEWRFPHCALFQARSAIMMAFVFTCDQQNNAYQRMMPEFLRHSSNAKCSNAATAA